MDLDIAQPLRLLGNLFLKRMFKLLVFFLRSLSELPWFKLSAETKAELMEAAKKKRRAKFAEAASQAVVSHATQGGVNSATQKIEETATIATAALDSTTVARLVPAVMLLALIGSVPAALYLLREPPVHFLTSLPGREETHVINHVGLILSFDVLKQRIRHAWGLKDTDEIILEYKGGLFNSDKVTLIGSQAEWDFARTAFRDSTTHASPPPYTSKNYGGRNESVFSVNTIAILVRHRPANPVIIE